MSMCEDNKGNKKTDVEVDIKTLATVFAACQKILLAFGDENRQHLILEMMQMGQCEGVRVGEITARTNLSRPPVSHHLRILKDAGILYQSGAWHYKISF